MPAILVIWEAEIERVAVQDQVGQNIIKTLVSWVWLNGPVIPATWKV
jgi:hypothetical protein